MASVRRRSLWGWSVPVRRLLAVLVTVPAAALFLGARGELPPPPDATLVVDPSTAPAEVLMALPRIGPVLAGRIVAARRERPFASLDDLDARVRGVGPATVEAIRPYLRFPGPAAAARLTPSGP